MGPIGSQRKLKPQGVIMKQSCFDFNHSVRMIEWLKKERMNREHFDLTFLKLTEIYTQISKPEHHQNVIRSLCRC